MKRVLVGVVAALAFAVAYAAGAVPGGRDCVWRSVDEEEYVGANEAILRSIPLSPRLRAAYLNTWNHGLPAMNKCLPTENGPPYGAARSSRRTSSSEAGASRRSASIRRR